MDATRSRIPSRSDIRLADNILCAARRMSATLAALTLFTMAGLPISAAATRPISVTTDAAVAVDPIVPIADNVDYVLKPAPSSLTSEQVLYKAALVATVPTSESRFSDDLPASDQPREASGRLLSLVISLLVALVALASGIYLYASKARTPARQSAATAIYLAGAAFILYNTGALHEVWLGSRVGDATNPTDRFYALAAAGSPLVLVFVGWFLTFTAIIGENHWPRWSGTLGMVSIAAAAYVMASAFFRTEALVFVDNATDAPYRVAVDGVPLGVLDARSHASFVLCRGGLLHQHTEPATLSLQRPQDSAPRTSLISLDARQFRRMVVNVEGRNSYQTVALQYR